MTVLTKDTPRELELGEINELLMSANTVIYEGAAVGLDATGFARSLIAGDRFVGFCEQTMISTLDPVAETRVRVRTAGKIKLNVAGLTLADVSKPVYASDDNTFTLVAQNHSAIGRVYRVESPGVGIVVFDVNKGSLGFLPELIDQSGGTVSHTLEPFSSTYQTSEIADAIASLTAQVNAVIRQLS